MLGENVGRLGLRGLEAEQEVKRLAEPISKFSFTPPPPPASPTRGTIVRVLWAHDVGLMPKFHGTSPLVTATYRHMTFDRGETEDTFLETWELLKEGALPERETLEPDSP